MSRHDSARLAELRRLLILDSTPERAYDDIARAFSSSLDVPMAMVSLLDDHRDWFKSSVGTELTESPADTSFCETFFNTPLDLIVVQDTLADDRFAQHPMVVGEPFIRFYAAARLMVRGQTIGTLCAYDFKPRAIAPEQVEQLGTLAGAVVELLNRRADEVQQA